MANLREPQTNIILIGQAPQREPYIGLFEMLQEKVLSREITLTTINTQSDVVVKVPGHPSSKQFKFANHSLKQTLLSHIEDRREQYGFPIDFSIIADEEYKVENTNDLLICEIAFDHPLIIVLPWSFDPMSIAVEGNLGIFQTDLYAPSLDVFALSAVEEHFKKASVHSIYDGKLTGEFENRVNELATAFSTKAMPYTLPKYFEMIRIVGLARFIETNSQIYASHTRPTSAIELTDIEQAAIESLRAQKTELIDEISNLTHGRSAVEQQISELVEKLDEINEGIRREQRRLELEANAKLQEKIDAHKL